MLVVKTFVDKTEGKGMGLHAAEFISKGTIVWIDSAFDKKFTAKEIEVLPKSFQEFLAFYGSPLSNGGVHACFDNARFINHSDDPNLFVAWENVEIEHFYAKRDIKEGEELTCNYYYDGDLEVLPFEVK